LKNANLLILSDDSQFTGLVSACWQTDRHAPNITVLNSSLWKGADAEEYDLVVLGPLAANRAGEILGSLEPSVAVILCGNADSREMRQLQSLFPRLVHLPLREDWAQTLVLVAGESIKRVRATRHVGQALSRAAQAENDAVLGRYMIEMKHSVNNALTSILGNAELLLLEPGQLSAQSLHQIKTMHSMTLRIHEIMQRFSSLAAEIREAEKTSQPETDAAPVGAFRRP
jgi:signal transduction histidine kinase